jgi:DNA polymerase-3 subunit delta
MDALTFLDKSAKAKPQPLYVLPGDEDFLKRQVLAALTLRLLGDADPAFALATFPGDKADWSTVRAELDTLPFLSPRRVVVVEAADPFVTRHRAQLEKCVGQPAANGVLILDVKAWPANTKLAKLVPDAQTIVCKAPTPQRLPAWCVDWAATRHGKKLTADAAAWLVELIGPEMGQLDQEIAKLAVYAGEAATVTRADVDQLVGRSRSAETFKIFDAIGTGNAGEALAMLARLFEQGEEPIAILGAFSWQLRRLAQIARLSRQGLSLAAAMERVGVPPFAQRGIEQQLRHLGRRRLDRLYDWLLETDFGMKGGSPLPQRLLLERLVVRLARPRAG